MEALESPALFETLIQKGELKQLVYRNTCEAFAMFGRVVSNLIADYRTFRNDRNTAIGIETSGLGEFGFELKFAGDILVFYMHTNVFEFSRDHEVMRSCISVKIKNVHTAV